MDSKEIASKWQKKWEEAKIFNVEKNEKPKFYVLEMFPYPSSLGLHVGHAFNYTIGDVYARFKKMMGFNVLHPVGFDSFGLPAENAAIQAGMHPHEYTQNSIKNYIEQQKGMGFSVDWSRQVTTSTPEFYKWDQWIFIQMFKKGLAYRKKSPINWCPKCNTVLANEQVVNGCCWRHDDTKVEVKHLTQWYLKTTEYAEELNDQSQMENWPTLVKKLQKNWIGKSYGTEIVFDINCEGWKVFTTRPDTLMGVTFLVISAQHTRLMDLVTDENKEKVEEFVHKLTSVSEEEIDQLEKEGIFTGSFASHPLTGEQIPVYAGNFVLADYGCGMVMAVPAHDQRDFEFAKKYNIPMKQVIAPKFILSGINSPKENVKTLQRRTVTAIIEHWNENKYLLLKEKENSILVGGGIENEETPQEAILREIKEETGFINIEIKKEICDHLFCEGYRINKNINQSTDDVVFYIKLKNEDKINSEVEVGKHELIWVDKKDILNKISWEHHKFIFNTFINGERAYTEPGVLINSGKFDGLDNNEAKEKITEELAKLNKGDKTVNYKLRDWLISRQRYWGTPIPIVYCEKCGEVADENLPIKLPHDVKFGEGNPLETNEEFLKCKCPKCGGDAKRETDTMDTFTNSSWYNLRYCDANNDDEIFDKHKVNYWSPIDLYIGGKEHACMHLIYVRFYTKFLRDLGLLKFDEPAIHMMNQGMIQGTDGTKMSKSKGNGVNITETLDRFGPDALRMYLVSVAGPESDFNWNDNGLESINKFLTKVSNYFENVKIGCSSEKTTSKVNLTLKEVSDLIERMKFNLAIIKIRELFDYLSEEESKENLEIFVKILTPFCPHLCEEYWKILGNEEFVSIASWPEVDESKINKDFDFEDEYIANIKSDIEQVKKLVGITEVKKLKLIISAKWKYELFDMLKDVLKNVSNPKEIIPKVMNSHLKSHGQDIMKILPKIVKTGSVPEYVSFEKEKKMLEELAKELNAEIVEADDSKEAKAGNAMPGKPAILIE